MEESWKDVKGYEGFFLVSNYGRIKTVPRRVVSVKSPTGTRLLTGKIHIPNDNGNGYKYFSAKINAGKKVNVYIHKAVALAFLPNPEDCPEINHIDGNKSNNAVSNLEWCSKSHNMRHAFANGLMNTRKGENVPHAKLKEVDVIEIRRLWGGKLMFYKDIANKFGISEGYVFKITKRHKWKHVI